MLAEHFEGVRELLILMPSIGLDLPRRERIVQDDEPDNRAFTRDQLRTVLQVVHPKHRDLFELLASTGL